MAKITLAFFFLICFVIADATRAMSEEMNRSIQSFRQSGFISNRGQWDDKVLFRMDRGHCTFMFVRDGFYFQRSELMEKNKYPNSLKHEAITLIRKLKFEYLGANKDIQIKGLDTTTERRNYFLGNDTNSWSKSVPVFRKIIYKNIYNAIDVKFYFDNMRVKSDYIVFPGGDPKDIRFKYINADKVYIDDNRNLVIVLAEDTLVEHKPIIYQRLLNTVQTVNGEYIIFPDLSIGISLNQSYDLSLPLIIDPEISFSTIHGGSGLDIAYDITLDDSSNVYITGWTTSENFPITNSFQDTIIGFGDVFITKLDHVTGDPIFNTVLGGTRLDRGWAIAIDKEFNIVVAGETDSDFLGENNVGGYDVFITKLNSQGDSIMFTKMLAGTKNEFSFSLSIDRGSNIYVTGMTESDLDGEINQGQYDIFLTKYNKIGIKQFTRLIGGSNLERGVDIVLDSANNIYLGGYSKSDFGGYQSLGGFDVFVSKWDSSGTLLKTFHLGGSGTDKLSGIALDSRANLYVCGYTESDLGGHINNGFEDGFITKWDTAGNNEFITLLGGADKDRCQRIVVDKQNRIYVTGYTNSIDFPLVNSLKDNTNGQIDAFVTQFDENGVIDKYSSLLGGSSSDFGHALTIDTLNSLYIAGYTLSDDFPGGNIRESIYIDLQNIFVTKLKSLDSCCTGIRGDLNNDDADANIVDLTILIDYIFRGGDIPECDAEADLNDDGSSGNILDLTFLVDFIFRSGTRPANCS